jgi:hypothetical protein
MLRKKFIRTILYVLNAILLLLAGLTIYYRLAVRVDEPVISAYADFSLERTLDSNGIYRCDHGWLKKEREGWWLMYLEGSPYEVGYAHGLLTEELNYGQEKAFLERLGEMIPSRFYQRFMLSFVRYFNRNLDDYVREEYRQEIYGVSRFASDEFAFMGPAYARMLNYHAAHDLGHAVQNMNLVACTAFGAWGGHSADSSLILGRNFDFFVNDDFARDKILCYIRPDSGYAFAMVTWAGFTGVVSGMNEAGLTVTLNAAKSSIPLGAKTPVSLLAREILQYAGNIAEAYAIAQSHETFVAESFLIGSAADGKAVIIEKTPETTALFDPGTDHIIAANHFQSDALRNDPLNMENMENETSVYRQRRVAELLDANPQVTPEAAAAILRDDKGLGGKDIGLGNEKAVNQYIAHHSFIFQPAKRLIWLAGPPFQLGEYWAYDLDSLRNSVLTPRNSAKLSNLSATEGHREIASDSILLNEAYPKLLKYRSLAKQIESGRYNEGDADSLIKYNPEFFYTYVVLGDYFSAKGVGLRAKGEGHRAKGVGRRAEGEGHRAKGEGLSGGDFYRMALEKEAPSKAEREAVDDSR